MKVCLVSDTYPPDVGGIQAFVQGLASHLSLDERIEEIAVVTFGDSLVESEKVNEKLEVLRVPQVGFFRKGLKIAEKVVKIRDYDVFHAMTLLASGFYTANLNRLIRRRAFVTVYGLDALQCFKLGWRYRFLVRRTFGPLNKIVAFSNSTKNEIKRAYNLEDDKFRVIYPGISVPEINRKEVENLRKRYGVKKDDFVVLYVGRLVKRKGADDLIRAVKRMKSERVKLLIVGGGSEREALMKLRKELNLQRKVVLVGNVPSVFPFYGLADVFCMPSKYLRERGDIEGLGLVFLEAQSYGVPVIGTRSGGIPEAIDDGKTGFIVSEENLDSIKERLLELQNNKKLRDKMGKNAIKFIKRKFNWKKCVNEHIMLYEGS